MKKFWRKKKFISEDHDKADKRHATSKKQLNIDDLKSTFDMEILLLIKQIH